MPKPELHIHSAVDKYLNWPEPKNSLLFVLQSVAWGGAVALVIIACLTVGLVGCIVEAGQTVWKYLCRIGG